MTKVYIGLGSNIEDREQHLRQAIALLRQLERVWDLRCSPVYETAPMDFLDQEPFLNMVVEVRTDLPPEELLRELQRIETELGRVRNIRYGPRTIDMDILLYGPAQIHSPDLQIPHPRMMERLFVLIPLADLYEEDLLPGNESLSERLNKLDGRDGVVQWKTI